MSTRTSDDDPATAVPAPPSRRPGRGGAFYVGLVLVLAGLGLLGYVGWQFYGTNIVSQRHQQRIVEDLSRQWRAAPPSTDDAGTSDVPLGKASGLIRIPALGDDYVIPVLEGVEDEQLSAGYGHFPGSAGPGEPGNFALAAHRVTHGEPLRRMPELGPGDQVVVETREAVYTYVLDTDPNDLVVDFEDIWVVDPLPTNPGGGTQPPAREPGQRLITLTTCSELFHTDNRMIAFGHLVGTQRK